VAAAERGQRTVPKTAVVAKAVDEQAKGNTSLLLIPTTAPLNLSAEANAEMVSLGRLKWLHSKTGEPWPHPGHTTAFIPRGKELRKVVDAGEPGRVPGSAARQRATRTAAQNQPLRLRYMSVSAHSGVARPRTIPGGRGSRRRDRGTEPDQLQGH